MNITKEVLEGGIVISPDGTMRKYYAGSGPEEGDIFVHFSEKGIRNEIKNDGVKNAAVKRKTMKMIVTTKTVEQAVMESILAHFYFSSVQLKPSRE